MKPDRVKRAAEVATDAIRQLERESVSAYEIAAGFGVALQRLPVAGWIRRNPGNAAVLHAGLQMVGEIVKAVRNGSGSGSGSGGAR